MRLLLAGEPMGVTSRMARRQLFVSSVVNKWRSWKAMPVLAIIGMGTGSNSVGTGGMSLNAANMSADLGRLKLGSKKILER